MQSQQNDYGLDVRNHHRICDAQKHLLHTLAERKEKFIDDYMINFTIQHNVYIISNIYSIDLRLQQRLAVATK